MWDVHPNDVESFLRVSKSCDLSARRNNKMTSTTDPIFWRAAVLPRCIFHQDFHPLPNRSHLFSSSQGGYPIAVADRPHDPLLRTGLFHQSFPMYANPQNLEP